MRPSTATSTTSSSRPHFHTLSSLFLLPIFLIPPRAAATLKLSSSIAFRALKQTVSFRSYNSIAPYSAPSRSLHSTARRRVLVMDPTTTEHDYRFPRRPDHHQYSHHTDDISTDSSPRAGLSTAAAAATSPDKSARALDLQQSFAKHDDLLGAALFPTLRDGSGGSTGGSTGDGPGGSRGAGPNLDQMQSDDPLAAQVWKFFTKTKQSLPNQQRMENLTWRMMALSMRKKQQEQRSRETYVPQFLHLLIHSLVPIRFFVSFFLCLLVSLLSSPLTINHCLSTLVPPALWRAAIFTFASTSPAAIYLCANFYHALRSIHYSPALNRSSSILPPPTCCNPWLTLISLQQHLSPRRPVWPQRNCPASQILPGQCRLCHCRHPQPGSNEH